MTEKKEEKKKYECGGQFQPCCWCGDMITSAMGCGCLDRERNEQDYYDAMADRDFEDWE